MFDKYANYVNGGHPETVHLMLPAPTPESICAILTLVLAKAGVRDRISERTWTIMGIVLGAIAADPSVSGMRVSLVSEFQIQPEGP